MATKFADIARGPKDLLFDDYTTKTTLKCKKTAGPVAVTIETERGESGALSSKIGTKFSYAQLNVDKAQATANGGSVLETSIAVAPGVKLSFKANKGADLGIDYKSGSFYATGKLDAAELSKFSSSASYALPSGIIAGGDATYSLGEKAGLTGLNLGASYTHGPLFASATTSSKFSQVTLGLLYQVNDKVILASQTTHSSEKPYDISGIGAAFKSDYGLIKAKCGASGQVSASLVREIAPKVSLTASGTVNVSDFSTFKYGLGITM
eukprot:scaffold22599_cov139-Cylindrotheca_fusiformis.AAC.1